MGLSYGTSLEAGVHASLLSHAFAAALESQNILNVGEIQVLLVCSICACIKTIRAFTSSNAVSQQAPLLSSCQVSVVLQCV